MDLKTLRLKNLPVPYKVFALSYLLALGLAYGYALLNIMLVVGLTPKDIAIHYYGSETEIHEQAPTGEGDLNLDSLEEAHAATKRPQPSLKNLVAEGHFHLFGMSSFFFGLGLLGLFTGVSEKWKTLMVGLPFFAVVVDNLSFMITRFGGPQFSYLTAVAGTVMAFSFFWLWVAVLLELVKGNGK